MKLENVKVTDLSARYEDGSVYPVFDLSWEHNGTRYTVSSLFPDVLEKRTQDGRTRKLSAYAACNRALIAQARSQSV